MQNNNLTPNQHLPKETQENLHVSLTEILSKNGPNSSFSQDPSNRSAPKNLKEEFNKIEQEEEEKTKNENPQLLNEGRKRSVDAFSEYKNTQKEDLGLNKEFEQVSRQNSIPIEIHIQTPKQNDIFWEFPQEIDNNQYCIDINNLEEKEHITPPLENIQNLMEETDFNPLENGNNAGQPYNESEQRALTNRQVNIDEDDTNRINELPREELNVQALQSNLNPENSVLNTAFIGPLEINGPDTALNETGIQLLIAYEVKTRFFRIVLFSIIQVLIFVLLYLGTLEKIKIEALIGLICIWPVVEGYQIASKINKGDYRLRMRRFKYFLLADWIYLFLFIIFCAVKINKPSIQPTFAVIPGFVNIILYFGPIKLPMGQRINIILFRFALWIQALLLGTKLDGRSQLNWGASFFTIWIIFVVFLLFAVFYLVFFFLVVYNTSRGRNVFRNMRRSTQIAGILWYLLVSILSVFYFVMLIGFTSYQDGDLDGMGMMEKASLAGLIYSWVLLLVTALGGKYFKDFIRGTTEQRLTATRRNNLNIVISFEIEQVVQPILYKIVSQTYYLPLQENLTKTSKEEVNKLKEQMWNLKNGFINLFVSNLEKEVPTRAKLRESLEKKPVLKKNEPPKSLQELELSFSPQSNKILTKPERSVSWTMNDLNKLDNKRITDKNEDVGIDNENICFICCLKKADALNMECGHGGMCIDCAQEAWKKQDHCVTCRQAISKVAKINLVKGLELGKVVYTLKKIRRLKRGENVPNGV